MDPSRPRRPLLTAARSAAVGGLATLLDLLALAVLVSGFGVEPRLASAPALALGVGAQFFGNKLVAFRDRSRAWFRQGAQFLVVEAIAFGLNLALYDLAVAHTPLPYLPLRLATTSLVYLAFCLPLWSLIFSESPPPSERAS